VEVCNGAAANATLLTGSQTCAGEWRAKPQQPAAIALSEADCQRDLAPDRQQLILGDA
jgi:hypothetical protein